MTTDPVNAAQDALSHGDTETASKLYESAARALLDLDEAQAIHLFKLAAVYAEASGQRQDELAHEVQQILERGRTRPGEIADIVLSRGENAQRAGRTDRAQRLYLQAIALLSRSLLEASESTLETTSVPTTFVDDIRFDLDKITHCSNRLQEIITEVQR